MLAKTLWFTRMGILHIYGLSYMKVEDKSCVILMGISCYFSIAKTYLDNITFGTKIHKSINS
jgi:hypothetical protein